MGGPKDKKKKAAMEKKKRSTCQLCCPQHGQRPNTNNDSTCEFHPVPFCIHGDLYGRWNGTRYHCRSEHRSRTTTPATTPHTQRSRASLRRIEGGMPTRKSSKSLLQPEGGMPVRRGSRANLNAFFIFDEDDG
jgi:hypothetical protein